jgi:hypothetical protein
MVNENGAAWAGGASGAGTGASIGTAVLPGWGTAAGAGIGAVVGAISSSKKAKEANAAMDRFNQIPMVDPMDMEILEKVKREKRAVSSGFTTDFQVASGLIREANAGADSVATAVGRNNPALAMTMLQQNMGNFDTSLNKALGTIGTRGMQYDAMELGLVDKITQRTLDLETTKAQMAIGQSQQALKDTNANNMAGIARLPGALNDAGVAEKLAKLLKGSGGV